MVDYEALRRFPGTRKDYDRRIRTICQECSVGCGLYVYLSDNVIVDIQGDEAHPLSRGRLCARGIAFSQGLSHPERITSPGIRNVLTRPFQATENWEKALDLLAERLRRIKDQHGQTSLVIGCDPEAGLDFYAGALRFARLWGTPHVYHPFDEPRDILPLKSPVFPCSDWINSQAILLVEADLAATHPVAFGWVLEAQQRGAKLLVADSRLTASMSKADLGVRIKPGSGNLLGLYLMKLILAENRHNADAVRNNFEQPDTWLASFDRCALEAIEPLTGLSVDQLTHISRYLADKGPAVVMTGKGLAYQPHYGIWLTLTTAMNWTGVSGGGWYPLDSGTPALDPDSDIDTPEAENIPAREAIFSSHGHFGADSFLDDVKALVCSGNCLNGFLAPLQGRARQMDFVVYFGSFPNKTWEQTHMVIPAAAWAERGGLCFSNDRAIQWAEKIMEPTASCCSGLDLWIGLAERLGWKEHFSWTKKSGRADHEAFYNWLLKRSPATKGCDLSRLASDQGLVFWPVDNPRMVKDAPPIFATETGRMHPNPASTAEQQGVAGSAQDGYPMVYQSIRLVSRSGDTSNWWPWTRELEDVDAVQIHPDVARTLGIENGDEVVVAGLRETLEGRAWLSRAVAREMVASPRRFGEARVFIYKKGRAAEEAFNMLKEYLP